MPDRKQHSESQTWPGVRTPASCAVVDGCNPLTTLASSGEPQLRCEISPRIKLVMQTTVEALRVTVLPRITWLAVERFDTNFLQPLRSLHRRPLWAVVAADRSLASSLHAIAKQRDGNQTEDVGLRLLASLCHFSHHFAPSRFIIMRL